MSRTTFFQHRGRAPRARPARARLYLERLEDRCLLSDYGLHTRSIVAADPTTGQVGVAVVSFPTGVPAIVPVGEPGVIVANQAVPSYADAQAIIRDVDHGDDAATALAKVLASDPNAAFRQFGVAALSPSSPTGVTVANFTGGSLFPQICGVTGPTYAVQANLQTSSAVCQAMAAGFTSTNGSLARRLLAALEAGTPVGNDQRGEFSASIRVFANSWQFSQFTPISADASVERSSHWQDELAFNLDSYLAWWTTGDSRDLVELTPALATSIQGALQRLGYFKGKVDGTWSGETENALFNFSLNNVAAVVFNRAVNVKGTLYIDGPFADYVVQGEARGVVRAASSSAATSNAGTRSIVAADPATGQVGIAVVSFPTGVPAIVPVGEPGVIVANQATPNYAAARAIIRGVEQGQDAATALANAIASDPTAQYQQFAVAALSPGSPNGVTDATFTGSSAPLERSSVTGPTYAVVADIQTSSSVAGAMGSAFAAAHGSLPRRLLAALLAGTSAGTDQRGEFSACIRVFSSTGPLASLTPISAESSVDRSRNWQDDLTFGLDAYLSFWTPGDPADLVALTSQRAIDILTVFTSLGYYSGKLDGSWNAQAEKALNTFSQFNLAGFRSTVKQNGNLFIDGPLAEYIVMGFARGVLRPNPNAVLSASSASIATTGSAPGASPVRSPLTGFGGDGAGLPAPDAGLLADLSFMAGTNLRTSSVAAAPGWLIDATPPDDNAFPTPGNQGEQHRMDLLTVLDHELGHILGYDHTDAGLMDDTLATGVREIPMAVIDQLFAGM